MAYIEQGAWVWLTTMGEVWLPAQVTSSDRGTFTVTTIDGEQFMIQSKEQFVAFHPSSQLGIDDMIQLSDLHESALLFNLKMRFERKEIYTYTGAILVAVNPYEVLPLYTPEVMRAYENQRLGALAPHIFAIADQAYFDMRSERRNQSVIISGESGAGKTESTKLILQYLATISSTHSYVEEQVLQSNPILEAFGNAKTLRNDNSSRFGKFIAVQFDAKDHICGAKIDHYLLEKSRVVWQSEGERNYHIFYALCKGADQAERQVLGLTKPQDYHYINQGGTFDLPGVDEADDYVRIKIAMDTLGFSPTEVTDIFKVVAAVLHLGNVQFKPGTGRSEGVAIANPDTLAKVAELLSVPISGLTDAMTVTKITMRGETIAKPLKLDSAPQARDALAKGLYSRLFDFIVLKINKATHTDRYENVIGILDIFGFENFQQNSFEQFCINYANEKLQQHFNQHIFKLEQNEYKLEGISWKNISFEDNQPCLDLIEQKGGKNASPGLLVLLDEQTRFPQASARSMLDKFFQAHEKHDYFTKPRTDPDSFIVHHYAGQVAYQGESFLTKNQDPLTADTIGLMITSKAATVATMFAADQAAAAAAEAGGRGAKTSQKATIAMDFKVSLQRLLDTLNATNPFFVRCIKPNQSKEASVYENQLVLYQLRYSGMLDTIRIRRAGYPVRMKFKEFCYRYRILLPGIAVSDPSKTAGAIMAQLKFDKSQYQLGKTKIFLRESEASTLEEWRFNALERIALKLQAWFRRRLGRLEYLRMRNNMIRFQALFRGYRQRQAYLRTLAAVVMIQSHVRRMVHHWRYVTLRRKVIKAQAQAKGFLARRRLAKMKGEADRHRRLSQEAGAIARQASQGKLGAPGTRPGSRPSSQKFAPLVADKTKGITAGSGGAGAAAVPAAGKTPSPGKHRRRRSNSGSKRRSPTKRLEAKRSPPKKHSPVRADKGSAIGTGSPVGLGPMPDKLPARRERRARAQQASFKELKFDRATSRQALRTASKALPRAGSMALPKVDKSGKKVVDKQSDAVLEMEEPSVPSVVAPAKKRNFDGVDSKKYAWMEWVMTKFRDGQKTGGFLKTKGQEKEKAASWSKDPIKTSMLRLDKAKDVEMAVNSFQDVMAYMGDRKHAFGKVNPRIQANKIIERGAAHPELRDEIYSSLVRQTNKNPKDEHNLRGWELLALCLGCFPPSSGFVNYLYAYCQRNGNQVASKPVAEWALFCAERLAKCADKAERKLGYGEAEYTAVLEKRDLVLRIAMMNGQVKSFTADSTTLAKELVHVLAQKIKMKRDAEMFALYAPVDKDGTLVSMDPGEHVMDALARFQVPDGHHNFTFKRHHLGAKAMTDPVAISLHYYQAVEDFLEFRFMCTPQDMTELIALQYVAEYGAEKLPGAAVREILPKLVPKKVWRNVSVGEWETNLWTAWGKLKTLTAEQAHKRFLDVMAKWPFFGASLFRVRQKSNPALAPELFIAINEKGVHLLDVEAKTVVRHYPFEEIANWNWSPGLNFFLTSGNMVLRQKFVAETTEGEQIAKDISMYIVQVLSKTQKRRTRVLI